MDPPNTIGFSGTRRFLCVKQSGGVICGFHFINKNIPCLTFE